MRKDGPLAVDVPAPDRDSPGWVKVGVIAAVGFVIGIAWPRVVGVKLGPNAPGETAAAAAAAASASASAARLAGHPPDPPPASVTKSGVAIESAGKSVSVFYLPTANELSTSVVVWVDETGEK